VFWASTKGERCNLGEKEQEKDVGYIRRGRGHCGHTDNTGEELLAVLGMACEEGGGGG
jgi:oxalate decarboxylase/phosphoglucose isomerase-like protein (cupin superfamily)